MGFMSDPIIRAQASDYRRFQLCEALTYEDDFWGRITVKPGASTDGASIPRLLWTLVGSPLSDSRVLRAAIIHDQLYCTLGLDGKLSRESCDAVFKRALIAAGVPKYRSCIYWAGVRTGGWVGWRNYAKHPSRVREQLAFIEWSSNE